MFQQSHHLPAILGACIRRAWQLVAVPVLVLGLTAGTVVFYPSPVYAEEQSCSQYEAGSAEYNECIKQDSSGLIKKYVDPFIKLLSGLVGIVVTISVIAAGIQYSMAADETKKITAAKHRIEKALTALLAYLLLVAFLQWLIPGGVV